MEMEFKYNKDQKRRDSLLHVADWETKMQKEMGFKIDEDFFHFGNLNAETLKILLDERFADPDERQNDSPSIQEFYEFMLLYPQYTAIGYAVGLGRYDYRTTVEGLEGNGKTKKALVSFANMFYTADEFTFEDDYQRCWYD